jgi:hypothetical protein
MTKVPTGYWTLTAKGSDEDGFNLSMEVVSRPQR